MILGVDVSHYDPAVDWPFLKTSGVEFCVVKASQGDYLADSTAANHLLNARAAGIICGAYHWVDPLRPVQAQVNFFLRQIQPLKPDFICLDVEQYWSNWAAFPAKITKQSGWKNRWEGKKKANPIHQVVAPRQISESARRIAQILRQEYDAPLVIYTRVSFINEYARMMLDWLDDYPLWLAQYPINTSGKMTIPWETLKDDLLPALTRPLLPDGCSIWTFWQFSGDCFRLPGMTNLADLNLYNGTREELEKFCLKQTSQEGADQNG